MSHLHAGESHANMPYGTVGPDLISHASKTYQTHFGGGNPCSPTEKQTAPNTLLNHRVTLARSPLRRVHAIISTHQRRDG